MEESILDYFSQWIKEFPQAVEMFTGERPTVEQKPADSAQLADWETKRSDFQWWAQESEEPQKFTVWIGAQETGWTPLGDQGEGSDPKDLFQEMVAQANQGAAAVLSSTFPTPLRFAALTLAPPPALPTLHVSVVSITFKNAALPPLLLILDPAAAKILAGPEAAKPTPSPETAIATSPASQPQVLTGNASMVERLMDLQLPVSVLLGQTVMPIRDALKVASGSLIELDRQLGDYVEILVHGTVVAKGKIVAVKGNYGVRIKEVISRKDRFALKDAA